MITNAQGIKLALSVLIGIFLASLQSVAISLPFAVLIILALVILVLRLIGNVDAVLVIIGVVVGVLVALLLPGMQVGTDPFLLYLGALWSIFHV